MKHEKWEMGAGRVGTTSFKELIGQAQKDGEKLFRIVKTKKINFDLCQRQKIFLFFLSCHSEQKQKPQKINLSDSA